MTEEVQGPASYFPSIEKKHGKPTGEWQQLVRDRHANALVGHVVAEGTG